MANWGATEDFEAASDRALEGWNGGSGFDDNWGDLLKGGTYADFKINTTQTKVGSRALQIDCSSASAYIQRGQAATKSEGNIFFAVRAAQTNKICYIYLTNGAGSGKTAIRIGSDGNLAVYTNAGYVTIGAYSANTWYYVNLQWDSINGVRAKMGTTTWGSFTTYGATTGTADISDLQIEQAAASGSDFWLDDVRLDDPLSVITDDIVAYYKMDETTGNQSGTEDSTANNNDLTAPDNVYFDTGKINNAAQFVAGNYQTLTIADASQTGLDLVSNFSFSAWIKLSNVPTTGQIFTIISKWDLAATQVYSFNIYYSGTQKFKLITVESSGGTQTESIWVAGTDYTILSADTWYHVVVIKNGSTATLYIDNSSKGGKTAAGGQFNSSANFYIGSIRSGAEDFDGFIDEVGVWSRALSATEVGVLYNSGNGLQYPFSSTPPVSADRYIYRPSFRHR